MLTVAFLAEKALAGAAERYCLLGWITATFVAGRQDLSLDLTGILSQHRLVIQVGIFWKFYSTERGGGVAGGAANSGL